MHSSIEGAIAMQLTWLLIHDGHVFHRDGTFEVNIPNINVLTNVCVISRVRKEYLPEGIFFADPIPQDSDDGVLHMVARHPGDKIPSIPLDRIEFYWGGRWINGRECDFDEITNTVLNGSVSNISPFFE